jgi:hypothetical protein
MIGTDPQRFLSKNAFGRWLALSCAVAVMAGIGIGLVRAFGEPPKIPAAHLRYVQLLSTAVSSRDASRVARMNDLFRSLHDEEKLSDSQWKAIGKILDMAKVDQWDHAMAACEKLKAAQGD